MSTELEFEYPSADFFAQIEIQAKKLPLTSMKSAVARVEESGSQSCVESLSELIVRLKIQVAADFDKHENELESVPYFTTYLVALEKFARTQYLAVKTALKSKHGHSGRVLYGTNVFRTGQDIYVSESSYGD